MGEMLVTKKFCKLEYAFDPAGITFESSEWAPFCRDVNALCAKLWNESTLNIWFQLAVTAIVLPLWFIKKDDIYPEETEEEDQGTQRVYPLIAVIFGMILLLGAFNVLVVRKNDTVDVQLQAAAERLNATTAARNLTVQYCVTKLELWKLVLLRSVPRRLFVVADGQGVSAAVLGATQVVGVPMQAPPQAPATMQVTVPDDAAEGTVLTVQAPDGRQMQVTVPPNYPPGSVMTVAAPPPIVVVAARVVSD